MYFCMCVRMWLYDCSILLLWNLLLDLIKIKQNYNLDSICKLRSRHSGAKQVAYDDW